MVAAQRFLCGEVCPLAHCLCALIIPSVPTLALLVGAFVKLLCATRRRTSSHALPPEKLAPPHDRMLWRAALVCTGLVGAGAVASTLIGALSYHDGQRMPNAWLASPILEAFSAALSAVIIGRSRHGGGRWGVYALVGGFAFLQTITTIVVLIAFLPPKPPGNAWLISTLFRVGACCALTLTALWPNRLSQPLARSDDYLQPPPGAPNMESDRARALLQQTDEDVCNAANFRRNQQNMWAEWLSYSSVQPITTGGDGVR